MFSINETHIPTQPNSADLSAEQLLNALSSLNRICSTINNTGSETATSLESVLSLIVESATQVVEGTSAVIYTYNPNQCTFTTQSRLSAGEKQGLITDDQPRPNGMGRRAIDQLRYILSYEETDITIHPAKASAGAKAVACFPLLVAGKIQGVLYVYLHEERHFSQLELLMLVNFVNQAAMAIYHASLVEYAQRSLNRKEEELARLRHAGLLISSRPRLKETLDAILRMALEVTNAEYGCFRLVDTSSECLITAAIAGKELGHPMTENLPINSTSVMGWVAQHRQMLCIPDVRVDPWRNIYYPLDQDLDIRSELAVPLISGSGKLEGILNLESPMSGAFSEEDSHLLQSLATQAVIAIQEASLMDALLEVAARLLVEPCEQVLKRLTELACSLLNAAASTIWIVDGEWLVLQADETGQRTGERIPLDNSLTGIAISQLRPIISDNVQTDPFFYHQDIANQRGWTHALIVPLVTLSGDDQNPIGSFNVYGSDSAPGRFTESGWDRKILTILAHFAALAVQNAAHQDDMRAALDQQLMTETFAAVGDVAVNLLHHINNKLGTIPVRVQGIQDKCHTALEGDPYLAANLREIEKSAREAMMTVRENLNLLHPIRPEPVDLANCVQEAIKLSKFPVDIQILADGLDSLPPVLAGKQNLNFVFTNLFENAVSAMQGKGIISIQASCSEHWVKVTVKDTGPGIPSHLHSRIFELHFSGSKEYTGKLGFGLWWAKALMTRLGGAITVESDGKSGTTFHLRLPLSLGNSLTE